MTPKDETKPETAGKKLEEKAQAAGAALEAKAAPKAEKAAPEPPKVAEQPPPKPKATEVAAQLVRGMMLEEGAQAVVETKKAEEFVYALSCTRRPRGKGQHAGIFFTVNPEKQTIHSGQWYSIYHDNTEVFPGRLSDMVCQQCLIETGERVTLPLWPVAGGRPVDGLRFRIPPRKAKALVWRASRSLFQDIAKRGAELLEKAGANL